MSSFQAEDSEAFAPDTALLLNVTEDHLDRHGTFEAYREAKLRVFANQTPEQVAVVPPGVEVPGAARRIEFGELPLPAEEIRLRGAHNLENAMGASAAAIASGVPEEAVAAALRTFPGVPHRLEEVGSVNGVLYVNDSKATNVSSAVRGIEAFDGGVHVILGGSLKGGGFEGLREAVASRCVAAYLIGEAAERLERTWRGRCRSTARATSPPLSVRDRGRAARRGGAAVARLRELRPVPRLRGAWRGLQVVGPAGMNPGLAVENRLDAPEAPGRVLDPLHRHALPARGRGGDGVLGELGGVAPLRARRCVLLPEALRDVRAGSGWCSCSWRRGTASG